MYNYTRLMALKPYVFATITDSNGNAIDLVEHPTQGDAAPIIAVSHFHKLAACTGFYDTDDMLAEHGEYRPEFIDGKLYVGQARQDG